MRKLIILALGGAAAAYVLKSRGEQAVATPSAGGYAPAPEAAPTVDATADTTESEAVVPDSSDDDPPETEDQGR